MNALAPSIRRAASASTLTFAWLPDRPMLKIAEIEAATGMGSTYLEEYFAEKCHRFPSDTNTRPAMRVPRTFAMELLTKSARYTAEEKRDAVASTFREFSSADLLQLRAQLDAELNRKA